MAVAEAIAGVVLLFAPTLAASVILGPGLVGAGLAGSRALAVVIASGLAATLVTVAGLGRATGSFQVAVLGAASLWLLASGGAVLRNRTRGLGGLLPLPGERPGLALGGLLIGAVAWVSLRYQMHDELPLFGHQAMVAQLRRGVYPPFYPPFPEVPARYHYGFDVLAGIPARCFALSADASIDGLTVLLGALIVLAGCGLARDMDRRSAWVGALVPILSSGLAYLVLFPVPGRHIRCLVQYHHPSCGVELYPPTLSNLFQHPVSMGLALVLPLVPLLHRVLVGRRPKALPIGAAALILGACSLGQVVYFALAWLSLLTLAVAMVLRFPSRRRATGLRAGVVLGASLMVAFVLGGMMSRPEILGEGLIRLRESPRLSLSSLVANQGVGLLVLPIALFLGWRGTWMRLRGWIFLLCFGLGGLVPPVFWVYTRSWDIIKFPSAAVPFLVLAAAVGLGRWSSWARLGGAAAGAGGGLLLMYWLLFPPPPELRFYNPSSRRPDPVVARTIDWLSDHDLADGKIFALPNIALELSVFGGLSVVGEDYDLHTMGIDQAVMSRERRLVARARSSLHPEALEELGVSLIVVSDEELGRLGAEAAARLRQGRYERIARIEGGRAGRTRSIYRVEPSRK